MSLAAAERWSKTINAGSLSGREEIWGQALGMFFEKPLVGWGPNTYSVELANRVQYQAGERRATHNDIMCLLTSTGLLGTVFFGLGLWSCLRDAWKSRLGPAGLLPFALTIAALTMGLSSDTLGHKSLWIILAVAAANGAIVGSVRASNGVRRMPWQGLPPR